MRVTGGGLQLSGREVQVLQMVCQAATNKEIAAQLDVTTGAAATYVSRLFRSFNLRNRVDLVRFVFSSPEWREKLPVLVTSDFAKPIESTELPQKHISTDVFLRGPKCLHCGSTAARN